MLLIRSVAAAIPACLLAILLTCPVSIAQSASPTLSPLPSDVETRANTEPSERSEQRLKLGGVVHEVLVKQGDKVKKDQLLMKLDCRVEQAEAEMYKILADGSEVEIAAAKIKNEQAKVEFIRWEDLFKTNAATVAEFDKARLDVLLTAEEIRRAEFEKQKNIAQYKRAQAVLQAMELRAAFDGIVERIDAKVGEVIDYQKPAITIVNNSPLWIQFTPKSAVSLTLQSGQELDVYYADDPKPHKAKIIFVSPVVKADSDRQVIRLEMPNPEGRPSGLQVRVALPPGKIVQSDTKEP